MIPLLRAFWRELWWSPEAARVWMRAGLGWLAAVAAQVMAYPADVVSAWGARDWAIRLAIAGVAGLALLLKAGERNPTDAATTKAVDRDLATVGEQKVVAPGPVIPASADPLSNPKGTP